MRRTLLLALGAQGNPSESFPSPASEEPPTCRGESASANSVALQFQLEGFPCVLSVCLGGVSSLLQPRWQRASVIKGTKRLGSESAFGIVLLLCEAGQATNKGEIDPSLKVRGS